MPDPSFITVAAAARWDIYGPIHKGLRLAHGDMIRRLGRADFAADSEAELLSDLRRHLDLAAKHLAHEEDHIHAVLELRQTGAAAGIEAEHDHHRARFEMLDAAIRAVEAAAPADRPALGRALYLAFTGFVAEDLAHMQREETEVWPQLCALFSDDELVAMEMAIVGSLAPEDHSAFMCVMLRAMNPDELRGLIGGIKANAPPEAYVAVMELAARILPSQDLAAISPDA